LWFSIVVITCSISIIVLSCGERKREDIKFLTFDYARKYLG